MTPRAAIAIVLLATAVAVTAAGNGDPRAGTWRMQPGGAIFTVTAGPAAGTYTLTIVDSPDYNVAPGALMGTLTATATAGVYDAELLREPGDRHSRKLNFIVEFDGENERMTMRHYRAESHLSLRRWLGYLFRLSVDRQNRPEGFDGAVRLKPLPAGDITIL